MICFLTIYQFTQASLSTLSRFYPSFDWWYCTWVQHFTVYMQCLYIFLLSYQVRLALFSGAPWKSNQQWALWNTEKTIYLFLDPRKTILTCVVVQPYETGRNVYKFTLTEEKAHKVWVMHPWLHLMLLAKPETVIQLLGLQVLFPLCTITKTFSFGWGRKHRTARKVLSPVTAAWELHDSTPHQLPRAELNNGLHLSVPIHLPASLWHYLWKIQAPRKGKS